MKQFCKDLAKWWHHASRAPRQPVSRQFRFRPQLEGLGDRLLLSTAVSVVQNDTVFEIFGNGALWEHVGTNPNTGWYGLTGNVAQISAGRDAFGHDGLFVLFNDGSLWEDTSTGWYGITSGVRAISASQTQANTVFVLFNNSALWEHVGVNPNTGWYGISGNVAQAIPSRDAAGGTSVFVLFRDGSVWEDTSTGWYGVTEGVRSISVSQVQPDTVFTLFTNGALWEHVGRNPNAGWFGISGNVVQASAGHDAFGRTSVVVLFRDGSVWEDTSTGWYGITGGTQEVAASSTEANTVFVTFNDGALWEHVGVDPNTGWFPV